MPELTFRARGLDAAEQARVAAGFALDTAAASAPAFLESDVSWVVPGEAGVIDGALTARVLWDWLYVDELWVAPNRRGGGLGRALMHSAEEHARRSDLVGVWLWTQSWQAERFYRALGYVEFACFPDFPRGHERIGFRKQLGE